MNLKQNSVAVTSASPEPRLRNKDLVIKPFERKKSVEEVRKVPLDELNKKSYLAETVAFQR